MGQAYVYIRVSHGDWKTLETLKMKVVMEKSWNMKNWPKFLITHGILPILPPSFIKFVFYLVTTKKLSRDLESLHFLTYSAKRRKCKIRKIDGHGKSRNYHGKVMEKYVFKSVGTLYQFDQSIIVWGSFSGILLKGEADELQ